MIADVKKSAEQKMQKSVEALKVDLGKVRTGRAHTGLLDHLRVDYYGSMMPISQVANVTLADAHTIAVQPWEKKMVQVVEKALRDSDLGINPATSGDVIRVPMPALTEERRKELVKVVHKEAETCSRRNPFPKTTSAAPRTTSRSSPIVTSAKSTRYCTPRKPT